MIESKKVIKLGFHSSIGVEGKQNWRNILNEHFDVKFVDYDYDYYIANETIYWSHRRMNEFLRSDTNAVRIFWCGEAVFPDLNLFDYAIWHCKGYEVNDRIIYDPLIRTEIPYMLDKVEEIDETKNLYSRDSLTEILCSKSKFCNFMYSNSKSHPMRDKLFYEISKYKRVESLGRHLKNIEIVDTRDDDDWVKKSIMIKSQYKFTIAAENAYFPGYTSEKIMTSMMANSIPIYWGNPNVGLEFNEESFINANKYSNIEDLIDKIKEINENNDLYLDILSKPWRTKKQIDECNKDINNLNTHIIHIFEQDKKNAFRRPFGCWPDYIYTKFMKFDDNKVF